LDAAIQAPLPMLETLSKIFNGNAVKILDIIYSSGSGAEIAASSRKGSTSKGTKFSKLYKYFK
jgi:hypothetical protein